MLVPRSLCPLPISESLLASRNPSAAGLQRFATAAIDATGTIGDVTVITGIGITGGTITRRITGTGTISMLGVQAVHTWTLNPRRRVRALIDQHGHVRTPEADNPL